MQGVLQRPCRQLCAAFERQRLLGADPHAAGRIFLRHGNPGRRDIYRITCRAGSCSGRVQLEMEKRKKLVKLIKGFKYINFNNNGNYFIDYIDCNNVSLCINVNNNKCIHLFEYSNNNDINFNIKYNLDMASSLIISKFYYNNKCNEVVNISLNKRGANIKYNFSSISNNDNFYKINVYHLDNNTSSDVFNRIVAKENSSNYFDINSYVDNGIKDCYLNQSTKIVTLGDSDNRVNPNMFISEEDVTAIHSSTIGSINEEDLFYLMSRGISYNDSVKLIIKGMILSNINPDMENMERILSILDSIGGE